MLASHPFRPGRRTVAVTLGAALVAGVATTSAPAQRHVGYPAAHPVVHPGATTGAHPVAAPLRGAHPLRFGPRRVRSGLVGHRPRHGASVFAPGFGPFATFPYASLKRGGAYLGFGHLGGLGFGYPGFGGDTRATASAEANATQRSATAIINTPGAAPAPAPAPTVTIPNPRLSDSALEAAGLAATGGGEGAAHTRKVLTEIAAAREADRLSRRTGSRYIYVDEDLRELSDERRALRRAEGRGRNPHVLYLGFGH